MSKKFCPLGFFSFYVNKQEAQAGGGHHCVEEACAIWNEEYEECSLKVGLDAVAAVAENFGGGQSEMPNRKVVEAPKLSVFDRLRKRNDGQKLPVVEGAATEQTTTTPPHPPPPPLPTNVVPLGSLTIPAKVVTPAPVAPVVAAEPVTASSMPISVPPPSPVKPIIQATLSSPPKVEELLKPPDVPVNELPVISVSIEES